MFNFNKVSVSKLFEEELYEIKDEIPTPSMDDLKEKKVVVMVAYARNTFPSNERTLLEKILKAAKVDMQNVAIVHANSEPHSFKLLHEEMQLKKLIVFGLKPIEVGLNVRLGLYQLTVFRDCQLFFADGLERISKDVQRKTYLWRTLQKMFEL